MTKKKAPYFKPQWPKIKGRKISIRLRKCDYCGAKEWMLPKLPNGLRRCKICALPPDERKLARSKLAVKEGEGLIKKPTEKLIEPVGQPDLIVKP